MISTRRPRAVVTMALLAMAPVAALSAVASVVAQPRCAPTRPDMLGPMYTPNAAERARTGEGFTVRGTVRSASTCAPIGDARLEWWSVNPRGEYDDAHRATQITGVDGRFSYETDPPKPYFNRPAHVHVKITAPGHRVLITQLYPKPTDTTVTTDFVLVKE
jgi:protocatechuate 3,4-dioxygenase beta subunit